MLHRYKPRWIAKRLVQAIEFSPVVVLTGARQTGKSTLLQQEYPFKDWPYFTLDDFAVRELAEKNPDELVSIHDRVVIDEVQKAPQLLSAIKKRVDRDGKKRFVLSGSANLLLMKKVTETLAGRCLYFDLLPFTLGEINRRGVQGWIEKFAPGAARRKTAASKPVTDFELYRGFLPPVTFLQKESHIADWWNGYSRTYLERDLRDLSQIANLPDFRKVMTMLAARSAQIFNQADISRSSGVSHATVNRYINLLEVSGLFVKLQPFGRNIKKRLVKSPKVFCLDTGLICSLIGIQTAKKIEESFRGQLFETFIFHNLMSIAAIIGGRLYYLRTQGGLEREIDFLLELNGKIIAIEAKASTKVDLKDAENMEIIKDMLPSMDLGLVIYNGMKVIKLRKNIFAIPCFML